jgi:carbamate kinase
MPAMLVAIGGNSLIPRGEPPTIGAQRAHAADTCRALADLVCRGWRLVLTHGNGPQVGAALLRSEAAAAQAYPLPLDMCVASTQGEIGALLQQTLGNELAARGVSQPVATLVTHVVVSPDDPAFAAPTKPIGPDRRLVPSPAPLAIVEERVIATLADAGVVAIALGGGGVPVRRRHAGMEPIEAVVDKDLASALLASRLRVDTFVMSTDVDHVYVDFARPGARPLRTVTDRELRRLAADGQFPAGTMGPKVEAALRFLAEGGREVIVTSPRRLAAAVDGREGSHVVSEWSTVRHIWSASAR